MSTFIQNVKEFYNTLPERFRNPPVISFIIIWCYIHWQLLFLLYTFDSDLNQGMKNSMIEKYIFEHEGRWGMVWVPLFWTLCSILIFYGISVITKLLNIFYSWVLAGVYSLADKRQIRTKEEYNVVNTKYHSSQSRVETLLQTNSTLTRRVEESDNRANTAEGKLAAAIGVQENWQQQYNQEVETNRALKTENDARKKREEELEVRIAEHKKTIKEKEEQLVLFDKFLERNNMGLSAGKIFQRIFEIVKEDRFTDLFFKDSTLLLFQYPNSSNYDRVTLTYIGNRIFTIKEQGVGIKFAVNSFKLLTPTKIRIDYDFHTSPQNHTTDQLELQFVNNEFVGKNHHATFIFRPFKFPEPPTSDKEFGLAA